MADKEGYRAGRSFLRILVQFIGDFDIMAMTSRFGGFCFLQQSSTVGESISGFIGIPHHGFCCKAKPSNLLVTVGESDAGFVFSRLQSPAKLHHQEIANG